MPRRRRLRPTQSSSWLRDRDLVGAWGFRVVASGLLMVIVWNVTHYTDKVDELYRQVPALTTAVQNLTSQLASEQAQISKLWDRIIDGRPN